MVLYQIFESDTTLMDLFVMWVLAYLLWFSLWILESGGLPAGVKQLPVFMYRSGILHGVGGLTVKCWVLQYQPGSDFFFFTTLGVLRPFSALFLPSSSGYAIPPGVRTSCPVWNFILGMRHLGDESFPFLFP